MRAEGLRPLSIGEVLDVAIKIYLRNASALFPLVAIVVAPVQAIAVLILASTVPEPRLLAPEPNFDPASNPAALSRDDLWATAAGTLLVVVLTFVATTLATAACFKAVSEAYLGEVPSWRSSLRFAGRRLASVMWVTVLGALLIFLAIAAAGGVAAAGVALVGEGTLFVGVPLILGALALGVWLWVSWAVAVPAVLTEETRGRRALARSFRLVRGRWWRTFGMLLVGTLLAAIVGNVITTALTAVLFTDIGDSELVRLAFNGLGETVGAVLTTPFTAAFVTVLYFDLRVRKEGFDLELLARGVGVAPRGSPGDVLPPPPPPHGQAPPFWPPPPGWRPQPDEPPDR